MKSFARASELGARHTWLWRYRRGGGDPAGGDRPRLLVDVSTILRYDAQTGIQRVVRAVWSELFRSNGPGLEVLPVYATSAHGYCYAPLDFLERKADAQAPTPVRLRSVDKFLGLDLSAHLLPKYRQQIREWRANGATVHVMVYDLLPLQRPAWFTTSAVNHFCKWLDLVAAEADQAICISDQVVRDLNLRLKSRSRKTLPEVVRVRLGGDIAATLPSTGIDEGVTEILERLRFRPAILAVGTVEPRKGYEVALAAFDHLWRRPDAPDLVIVGKPGWKTEQLQASIRSHPEFGRRLHWFDRMSDEGLCLLYEACRGVLVASRGEGWGLPLMEAAMHRRYVLARNLDVFREHGLPNILYFDDDSADALSERLSELVVIGQHPAPSADLPTWSDCVESLLNRLGLIDLKALQVEPLRIAS